MLLRLKNRPSISPVKLAIFISILFWIYLAMTSQMAIIHDSEGYQMSGYMLYEEGFEPYFQTGPNREPLYPMFISSSIAVGDLLHVPYKSVLIIAQLLILLATQLLMLRVLRELKINENIIFFILVYFGLSPAMITSALRLYSEVVVYPFIVTAILISYALWKELLSRTAGIKRLATLSALLGANFFALTMSKGVFELITPLYIIAFLPLCIHAFKNMQKTVFKKFLLFLVIFMAVYHVPLHFYKDLNRRHNGNYTLTNRGAWALYGNTARRMGPLYWKRFMAAVTFGNDGWACQQLFGGQECSYWTFLVSDDLGVKKRVELGRQGFKDQVLDRELIRLSVKTALSNPFKYAVLTFVESIKMFLWESTRDGYVAFPKWLRESYHSRITEFPLVVLTSLLTSASFVYGFIFVWRRKHLLWENKPEASRVQLVWFILVLITFYVGIYSIFYILRRYAFPIAPLYLVLIGVLVQDLLMKDKI